MAAAIVNQLGNDGWLRYIVPKAYGGIFESFDVRTLCLARETLAAVSGLADFAFAMQGIGTGPITLFGSDALKRRYLPRIAAGTAIAAFAISEADAGSDVAAMQTTARRDGDAYVIDGEKTWISNAGIADHYVFAAEALTHVAMGTGAKRAHRPLAVDADHPQYSGVTGASTFLHLTHSVHFPLTDAASRPTQSSAGQAKDSGSRLARSMSFVRPLAPRRSGSPVVPSTKQ